MAVDDPLQRLSQPLPAIRLRARSRDRGGIQDEVENLSLRSDTPTNNPETLVLERIMEGEVQAALDSLPEDFRTVLLMVDLQELRYEEAANVLEIPVGTVRSRVSRGRAMLKKVLADFARARGYARKPDD